MSERERLAGIFRDWIHEQPFSRCNASCDTCPDWPMAYELADLVVREPWIKPQFSEGPHPDLGSG